MASDEKAVIFSQWTSYLDIIEQELRKEGHFYCRIDGTMTAEERESSMKKFGSKSTDSFQTPRFILCSLHACGTGTERKLLSLVMLTLSPQE
jgi:SNF2 family DNA or RNA helicase